MRSAEEGAHGGSDSSHYRVRRRGSGKRGSGGRGRLSASLQKAGEVPPEPRMLAQLLAEEERVMIGPGAQDPSACAEELRGRIR